MEKTSCQIPFVYYSFLLLFTYLFIFESHINLKAKQSDSSYEDYKKLQDKVEQLTELAILGKIALDIIHEINNPLQVMLGFTQDILETMPQDSEYREQLVLVEEEILRCSKILRNIRILGGNYSERSYQDLDLLIEGFLPLLNISLKKKKLTIEKSTFSEIGLVIEETNKLKISLLGVLLAAINKSQENNKIYVIGRDDGEWVSVLVRVVPTKEENKEVSFIESYLEQTPFVFKTYWEDTIFVYQLKLQKQK